MEATSSTACDQGLIKRVHVCWGPALSFFYCMDLCYFEYMRNSLDGFCQHFLQQILLGALQLTIRSSVRIDYKLNCASYKVYECNLVFVGLCTQDEDIAISW